MKRILPRERVVRFVGDDNRTRLQNSVSVMVLPEIEKRNCLAFEANQNYYTCEFQRSFFKFRVHELLSQHKQCLIVMEKNIAEARRSQSPAEE